MLVELIDLVNYNFSFSNDLTLSQMTYMDPIPDCDSHSLDLLDLFLCFDADNCC